MNPSRVFAPGVALLLTLAGAAAGADGDHWAATAPKRPPVPAAGGLCLNPIDRFILAALERWGAGLAPEAERTTLIRRVSFDLTGLPPSPEEIDEFVGDPSPGAYARMVDRYLASPRYGERWGKFWLDAAGYADSNGYFNADSDRPLAWRYRDYVIRAFNRDQPYARFVTEQLAGDELVGYRPGGDVTPTMVEPLTATHFLRNAPDGTGESDGNPDEVRTDRLTVLEGNLQNIVNCLLGLTVQCARCHDHKFEPVSLAEYYSLQAILSPVYNPDRWVKPNDRVVSVGSREDLARRQRRTEQIDRQVQALQKGLAAFADPLREQLLEERVRPLPAALREQLLQAVKTPEKSRSAEQKRLLTANAKVVPLGESELSLAFPEYAALREQVQRTVAQREKDRPAAPERLAAFVETDPDPPAHRTLKRGQHSQPDREVPPGTPAAYSTAANSYHLEPRPAGCVSTGRRTSFARWVTSPENPLFARVMVNRIWLHHFGVGLVATPDNLGRSGGKPSHPELLDYLASEFVASGTSVKTLHRLILGSAVYRQASTPRNDLARVDPGNRLLGRFPLRRLDAEALRDAMLAVSGELDPRLGGAYTASQRSGEGTVEINESDPGARRRSVYLQQRRTQVVTLLQLFDAPALLGTCGQRFVSTVPLQPLALLNSDFTRARARSFAERLGREARSDPDARLRLAFRLGTGRPPLEAELEAGRRFLQQQRAVYASDGVREVKVWTDLAQLILASNAFLYVE